MQDVQVLIAFLSPLPGSRARMHASPVFYPRPRAKRVGRGDRRTLANSRFLTPHIPKPAQPPAPQTAVPTPCSHHFLEPLSWMRPELEQQKLEGKLDCPKCKAKVGSYAWQGMKCSCGEWVVPGISIARGKVDEIRVKL